METFGITLNRMVIFFLILLLGAFCGKRKIITAEDLPSLQMLVTKIFLPAVIFYGTYKGATLEAIVQNLPMIGFAIVFYAAVGLLLFGLAKLMRLEGDYDKGFTFCFLFGNTLFVGMPLLTALFPERGMLYLALFTIVDQAVFWTVGIWLATGRDRVYRFSLKSLVTPNTISLALVFALVVFSVPLPGVLLDALQVLYNGTGALCMLYLGALMHFSNWKQVLKRKDLYIGILVKMVALPVIGGHVLAFVGMPHDLAVAMVVLMSLPVMTVVPMIARAHGNCGEYAAGVTAVTLAASVVTVPLVQLLAFM